MNEESEKKEIPDEPASGKASAEISTSEDITTDHPRESYAMTRPDVTSSAPAVGMDKSKPLESHADRAETNKDAKDASAKKPPATNGEKVFNRRAYIWLDWLGNATLSVGLAYGLKRTEIGNKWVFQPVKNFFQHKVGKVISIAAEEQKADTAASIFSLMLGGTTLMVPLKKMEDNKLEYVKAYNEKHGSGISDPELEKASLKRIEDEPKQNWSSVLGSRFASLAIVFPTYFSPIGQKYIEPAFKKVSDAIYGAVKSRGKQWNFVREPGKPLTNGHYVTELGVSDLAWSAYVATLLYAFTRLFGCLIGDKKEQSDASQPLPAKQDAPQSLPAHKDEAPALVSSAQQTTAPSPVVTSASHEGVSSDIALQQEKADKPETSAKPSSARSFEPKTSYRDLAAAQNQVGEPARA